MWKGERICFLLCIYLIGYRTFPMSPTSHCFVSHYDLHICFICPVTYSCLIAWNSVLLMVLDFWEWGHIIRPPHFSMMDSLPLTSYSSPHLLLFSVIPLDPETLLVLFFTVRTHQISFLVTFPQNPLLELRLHALWDHIPYLFHLYNSN